MKDYLDLDAWDDSDWLKNNYNHYPNGILVKSKTNLHLMTKFMNAFNWLDKKQYAVKQNKVIELSNNMYLISFSIIPL